MRACRAVAVRGDLQEESPGETRRSHWPSARLSISEMVVSTAVARPRMADSATCFVRRPALSSFSLEIHDEFSEFIAGLLRSLILSLLN